MIQDQPGSCAVPRANLPLAPADDRARAPCPAGRTAGTGPAESALSPSDATLTHGETRVLHYLPTNLSAREIAGELYLSVNTVKTQQHLYQNSARSRTQAVEQARALGLLAPFLSQAPIGGSGA